MITIKELNQNNLEQAKELYCECFNKEKKDTTLPLLGTIIGAFLNDELIGMIQLDYINNIFENTKMCYINNVCIKPNYQNQGYGALLLNECIKIAKNNNSTIINLTSNKKRVYAHQLYKKLGFDIIDTTVFRKDI